MPSATRTIMGVDPGTRRTGWGVVRQSRNGLSYHAGGTIATKLKAEMADRLATIFNELSVAIVDNDPDVVVIEESFGGVNPKTAIVLGQARGVAMVAAHQAGRSIVEYTPRAVKKAVVGSGRADKSQVQYMIKSMLLLPEIPESEDEADALALAICHANAGSSSEEPIGDTRAPTKGQQQLKALGLIK
ncbi:MAG: crossover junction endodeoxyribonuclease RuvC [Candidatus Latescibacteria bacterium]|nr:crossover junction endodeoxyribonuclease RuvC [Candidatus Latescibacterota bacterium]